MQIAQLSFGLLGRVWVLLRVEEVWRIISGDFSEDGEGRGEGN
jgi:hypothetical protein